MPTGPIPVTGPFDASQISDRSQFVDFGRILVPAVDPNLVIKGELDQDSQKLVAITLELANSVLQVSVFSAASSEEVWPDVREQLATGLSGQGAEVEHGHSSLGPCLNVALPASAETGQPMRHIRFVGFDGPRWFLRGSITGAAITNPVANQAIETLFRSLVVDRGTEAMPPRELIALAMPAGNVAPPRQL